MACSHYNKTKCSISTGHEDNLHQESEDRAPRLCLWTGCGFLTSSFEALEEHAQRRHGCLPPRCRTEPECQQLALFDVGDYGGRRTTLFGRNGQ
jgi:hypothetical protein